MKEVHTLPEKTITQKNARTKTNILLFINNISPEINYSKITITITIIIIYQTSIYSFIDFRYTIIKISVKNKIYNKNNQKNEQSNRIRSKKTKE